MLSKLFLGTIFIAEGFEEIIFPAIWEESTFLGKVGPENAAMMWRFKDKGNRDVCLVPEITGMAQEMWNDEWSKKYKTRSIFYVQRCYRYERPQAGRYREFTQLGIEMLGSSDSAKAQELLKGFLDILELDYVLDNSAKRGLSYYASDGFEVAMPQLGAQKQIAGGGAYKEGVGWACGLDRILLCLQNKS